VNNAGYVLGVEHVGDIADADIEGMFATNVFGLISMTQLLVKGNFDSNLAETLSYASLDFKAKKAGHIINLGSIAGREAYAGASIYTATKHAVNAFTGSMRSELVNTPIRVTEIQPGSTLLRNLSQVSLDLTACLGMVETEFSIVRFRGNADAAAEVYQGLQPCVHFFVVILACRNGVSSDCR
jgi:3-hydroxy acid dehydrogenase/malonic semialdehyde reductase